MRELPCVGDTTASSPFQYMPYRHIKNESSKHCVYIYVRLTIPDAYYTCTFNVSIRYDEEIIDFWFRFASVEKNLLFFIYTTSV